MGLEVDHEFVATVPLGPDPDQVQSTHWNAPHVLVGNLDSTRVELDGAIAPYADGDTLHSVLSGIISSITGLARFWKVRKNSTGSDFSRSRLNLIEGTGVTITVADDSANDEVDVTIAATGGGGGSDFDKTVPTYRFPAGGGYTQIAQEDPADGSNAYVDMQYGEVLLVATPDGSNFVQVGLLFNLNISLSTVGSGSIVLNAGPSGIVSQGAGKGFRFRNLNADPSSPVTGLTYYNTVSNKLRCWDGSAWNDLW